MAQDGKGTGTNIVLFVPREGRLAPYVPQLTEKQRAALARARLLTAHAQAVEAYRATARRAIRRVPNGHRLSLLS